MTEKDKMLSGKIYDPAHADNVFAAGVPCKVIREITEEDGLDKHPELF